MTKKVMPYGKYKGLRFVDIVRKDKEYALWARDNVSHPDIALGFKNHHKNEVARQEVTNNENKDVVSIFTDGGCRGQGSQNTVGAAASILRYKGIEKELAKAYSGVTSNEMELIAVLNSLKSLKRHDVPIIIYTDSQYVELGFNGAMDKWMASGWKTTNRKTVAHVALWKELKEFRDTIFQDISVTHVKAHNGLAGNERADKLANKAMDDYQSQLRPVFTGRNGSVADESAGYAY